MDIKEQLINTFENIIDNQERIKIMEKDILELQEAVTTLTGHIDSIDGKVNLKVNKDEVIKEINDLPDGDKINPSKIRIDGRTVIEDGSIKNNHIEKQNTSDLAKKFKQDIYEIDKVNTDSKSRKSGWEKVSDEYKKDGAEETTSNSDFSIGSSEDFWHGFNLNPKSKITIQEDGTVKILAPNILIEQPK